MTYDEMMKTKTEEEILEYMDSLSEKEVLEFLEVEPAKMPTKAEIMSKTKSGWMGSLVMGYIEETYPKLFPHILLSGRLMKIVEERTTEANEQVKEILTRPL